MAPPILAYESVPTQRLENHAFSFEAAYIFNPSPANLGTLGSWIRPAWQHRVRARLDQLRALPQNWDGYHSVAISPSVVQFVMDVLGSAMPPFTSAPSIVPVSGGGLQLEWHEGGLDIELYVSKPYQAELYVGYLDGRPSLEMDLNADFEDLTDALREIA